MTWSEITALITSGLFVGFINTLAGGGTIISISLLMFMGLPAGIANGTNRIAVVIQTFVAVASFRKQKLLDFRKGIILGIPTVLGSIAGAVVAVDLNERVIEKSIAFVMVFISFFIIYKPQKWIKGQPELTDKPVSILLLLAFFLIGAYGGFIHIGVGYLMIAAAVFGVGYDLVRANAIKNFLVLLYAPFTLLVFILSDQVNYSYGLVHSIGNVIGAYLATRFAVKWGSGFVMWIILLVVAMTVMQIFGVINFREMFQAILK